MAVSQFTTTSGGVTWEGVNITAGRVSLKGVLRALILDADGDTSISSSTDDIIDYYIGDALEFTMSTNAFNVLSGSSILGAGTTVATFIPLAAQENLSGPNAVAITTYYSELTTTGADAFTLIDGAIKGQLKKIKLAVDGGDATLTPTNLSGGTTITFADAGDYVVLLFNGTDWVAIELGNDADGVTAPVIA